MRRRHQPPAEAAQEEAQDAPEAPEAEAPLSEPEQFAAEAERLRAEAAELVGQAQQARDEAQAALAAAQQQAAEMVAAAKAAAQRAEWTGLRSAERTAQEMQSRAGVLARAAVILERDLPEAEQAVAALEAERARTAEAAAGIGSRLAELAAERAELDGQLAAALEAADVDQVSLIRTRLEAVGSVEAALSGQRDAATQRLWEIAEGRERGELYGALGKAERLQAELRRLRNSLDPERPEAVEDRRQAEWRAIFEAQGERLAEERRQPPQQQRRIVHLG